MHTQAKNQPALGGCSVASSTNSVPHLVTSTMIPWRLIPSQSCRNVGHKIDPHLVFLAHRDHQSSSLRFWVVCWGIRVHFWWRRQGPCSGDKIPGIREGNRHVVAYAAKFWQLAANLSWNNETLIAQSTLALATMSKTWCSVSEIAQTSMKPPQVVHCNNWLFEH